MSTNAKNMIPHLDEALIDLLNGTLPTLHWGQNRKLLIISTCYKFKPKTNGECGPQCNQQFIVLDLWRIPRWVWECIPSCWGILWCINSSLDLFQSSSFGFRYYLDHKQNAECIDCCIENEGTCRPVKPMWVAIPDLWFNLELLSWYALELFMLLPVAELRFWVCGF